MGWQRHQMDHMQIICTSFPTDNHASTSSFIFLQAGYPDARGFNSVKALKTRPVTVRKQFSSDHMRRASRNTHFTQQVTWSLPCPGVLYHVTRRTCAPTTPCDAWCLNHRNRSPCSSVCSRRALSLVSRTISVNTCTTCAHTQCHHDVHRRQFILNFSYFFCLLFYRAPHCWHCKRCTSYGNSVRLSIRPSHAGIVLKRLHVARCSLHCQIAKCV